MPFTQISLEPSNFNSSGNYVGVERSDDVVISLIEVAKEDWSLGNGVAPYA